MEELERVKEEIKSTNMVLRATLIILIFALGVTYAGQVKDDFDISLGNKTKCTSPIRVDEVDLYGLYKNQSAILDATTGGRKFAGRDILQLSEQKKLVRAKQKKMSGSQNKMFVRR